MLKKGWSFMSSKPVLLQLSGIVHHVVRFDRMTAGTARAAGVGLGGAEPRVRLTSSARRCFTELPRCWYKVVDLVDSTCDADRAF